MNTVANAGAVRGGIIGAEQGERRAPFQGRVDSQRNQMRFRCMVLTQSPRGIGTSGVEEAQTG